MLIDVVIQMPRQFWDCEHSQSSMNSTKARAQMLRSTRKASQIVEPSKHRRPLPTLNTSFTNIVSTPRIRIVPGDVPFGEALILKRRMWMFVHRCHYSKILLLHVQMPRRRLKLFNCQCTHGCELQMWSVYCGL